MNSITKIVSLKKKHPKCEAEFDGLDQLQIDHQHAIKERLGLFAYHFFVDNF